MGTDHCPEVEGGVAGEEEENGAGGAGAVAQLAGAHLPALGDQHEQQHDAVVDQRRQAVARQRLGPAQTQPVARQQRPVRAGQAEPRALQRQQGQQEPAALGALQPVRAHLNAPRSPLARLARVSHTHLQHQQQQVAEQRHHAHLAQILVVDRKVPLVEDVHGRPGNRRAARLAVAPTGEANLLSGWPLTRNKS